jgi:hypothetical protein
MKSTSAKFIENSFQKWSVSHYWPVNDDDELGGAKPVAVSDLSRDGKRSNAIVLKARPIP